MSLIGDIGKAAFGNQLIGSTVGALAGDLLQYDAAERSIDAQMQQAQRNIDMQREFAQHGVRWRVEDAKAAGVHPLFALGGSGAAFSPNPIVVGHENEALGRGISNMGQNLSRAIGAQETQEQRLARELQMEAVLAGITKDYAQASYWQNMAANLRQGNKAGSPFPGSGDIQTQPFIRGTIEERKLEDIVKMNPSQFTSRDSGMPGVAAARGSVGFHEFTSPNGRFKFLLPETGQGNPPEDIDAGMYPLILGANLDAYGPYWLLEAMDFFTGHGISAVGRETRRFGNYLRSLISR